MSSAAAAAFSQSSRARLFRLRFAAALILATALGGQLRGADSVLRLPLRAEASTPPRADRLSGARRSTPAILPEEPGAPVLFHSRPGPWGDLDYFTVYLEASVETLKRMELPTYDTLWKFVGLTEEQVAAVFTSAKLPAALEADLLDRTHWRREDRIVVVAPRPDTVLGLPAEARAAIYRVLGRWEENVFQHEPIVVPGHAVRTWLRRANLPEEIVATIEKTAYERSKNMVFADLPLVLRMVTTEEQRLKIRKAVSRTPTLVVKLRLTPETDIAAISEYWGGFTRTKDIQPFLESLSQVPGVNVLNIIHLLPSSVRSLLYTFPSASHGRTGYYPDCHWTSLNFGNFDALDRLADPPMATAYTLENYMRIPGENYRFGDVLFFMDGTTGNAIHSCVYLADHIVYTKNGRSPLQPWVLMKLDDVITHYSMFYQPQLACYRRKPE